MEKETQASKWKCCSKLCVHVFTEAPCRKAYLDESLSDIEKSNLLPLSLVLNPLSTVATFLP